MKTLEAAIQGCSVKSMFVHSPNKLHYLPDETPFLGAHLYFMAASKLSKSFSNLQQEENGKLCPSKRLV